MQTPTVIPSEDYFKSLNIPPIRFDFNEDQLRIHVICAMLCCPRKMDDDGNISCESVDRNFREISGGCLDSNIIACAVTKDDAVQAEEFAKNPERLLQHSKFADIVEMDESCLKFRPVLPDALKFLYGRIRRGIRCSRAREEQQDATKEKELSRPENVYRMKVACNFLMELINRERHSQGRDCVPWQVIQKRYQNMVTKAGNRDVDLMDKYRRYGLDFTDPVLNSEVVKKLTGRKKITKGLNQAVFYGIHCDNSSSLLMVGINENARPYSEEELMRAAKVCEASTSIPALLSDVTSLYQNTSRSPLFNVMSGGRKLNKRKKWEKNNSGEAYQSDINESPHIALFSSEDDCDSESGSEEPRNEIGVYTTDEENDLEQ